MFIINTVSTCFGHHYAHLQENKTCVTARGVLHWFCWMWLVAVVGRCVVGCEHCEGYCLITMHGHRNLKWLLASSRLSVRPYVRTSICPHGTNRLPLGGFSLNLIFQELSMCRENSSLIKILKAQWVFYMKVSRWSRLRMRNVSGNSWRENQITY